MSGVLKVPGIFTGSNMAVNLLYPKNKLVNRANFLNSESDGLTTFG